VRRTFFLVSDSQASPLWQAGIFAVAGVFLLLQMWSGWRRGVVRSAIHFVALVLSTVIGWMAAQAAMAVGRMLGLPDFLFGLVVGFGVGFFSLFAIAILGSLLFKRTAHQRSGIVRFVWGVGGAFFGLLIGLLFLWGGISIIRGVGALAEARIAAGAPQGATDADPTAPTPERPSGFVTGLATLKESLELGPPGEVVKRVDVVQPETYDLISRTMRLIASRDAMVRFVEYPGVQQLLQNPKILALLGDPDVVAAAQKGDVLILMQNPKLLAAVNDPELARELGAFDFKAALNYALASPTPTPGQ
jgi:hypothetical protein